MIFSSLYKLFPGFPLLLSGLLFLPGMIQLALNRQANRVLLRVTGATVCATALIVIMLVFANLTVPNYIDNVEPTVIGDAWIWLHGGALYPQILDGPSIVDPELRGLLYGPLTFIALGIAPFLFGPSILVSKLPAVGSFICIIVLTWFACRRMGADRRTALLAVAVMTTVLGISDAAYWVRSDTLLILIGALCAWLSVKPANNLWSRGILLGVLAGSASAFKLHGLIYVAPACLISVLDVAGLFQALSPSGQPLRLQSAVKAKSPILLTILIVVTAVLAVGWPFLLRGISIDAYAVYLKLAAHHGISILICAGNFVALLSICLPIAVLGKRMGFVERRVNARWLLLSSATLVCALVVAVIAGKPGAGFPHLLPFLPYAAVILCYVLMCQAPAALVSIRSIIVVALFAIAFCIPVFLRAGIFLVRLDSFKTMSDGVRQVQQTLHDNPHQIVAVGYSDESFLNLRLSYLRILPVFAGSPLFYDATAIDDLWQGGVDRSVALQLIDRCTVDIWLLPPGLPFTIQDYYGGFTFSAEFRSLFEKRYQAQAKDGVFTRWVCRRAAT